MKTIILGVLVASGAFASIPPSYPSTPGQTIDFEPASEYSYFDPSSAKDGFLYVRFLTAEGDLSQPSTPHPGIGLGYRKLAGNGAVDISVNGIGYSEKSDKKFFWSAPKASFIRYFSPLDETSTYLGCGFAWGGIQREKQRFIGLIPSLTVGCEFLRRSSVLGFAEFSVSQPVAAVKMKGKLPGPIGEISIGAGF